MSFAPALDAQPEKVTSPREQNTANCSREALLRALGLRIFSFDFTFHSSTLSSLFHPQGGEPAGLARRSLVHGAVGIIVTILALAFFANRDGAEAQAAAKICTAAQRDHLTNAAAQEVFADCATAQLFCGFAEAMYSGTDKYDAAIDACLDKRMTNAIRGGRNSSDPATRYAYSVLHPTGTSPSDETGSDSDSKKRERLNDLCENATDADVKISACSALLKMPGNEEGMIEQTLSQRGAVYGEVGKYQLCIDDLGEAMKHHPSDEAFVLNLTGRGLCYSRIGKYKEAVDDLTAALSKNPNDAQALYLRGMVEFKLMGKKAQGQEDLDRAYALDPSLRNNP